MGHYEQTYWTSTELSETAKHYAKGKGKLKAWALRITGGQAATRISLLVDILGKDGMTTQVSIAL